MTKTTDTNKVKWVNWYGDFGVGIYQHCCGGNSDQWYKPSQNCKMQSLNRLFCPVCRETIVAEIDRRTNAIVRYLPVESQIAINTDSLSFQWIELMKPAPNTLKITWELNGQPLSTQNEISNIPKNQFKNGLNTVSVKVVDTSNYLRIDNYSNLNHSIIQWDVTKTVTGFELVDDQYEFQTTLYPNPISSVGSLRVCSKKPFKLKSIDVVALSGAMVISNVVNKTFTTCGEEQINLSGQPAGNYYMVLNVDKHRISIPFMIKN